MHPAVRVEQVVVAEAVLSAARETGLLDHLAAGDRTPEDLATELGLDERLLPRTLDVLVAMGLVEAEDGGRLRAHPMAATVMRSTDCYAVFADVLRGRTERTGVDRPGQASSFYPDLVGILGDAFASAAADVAPLLTRPGVRVLDIGAGAAPWSLAIARREPTARVVAVDLPAVAGATRRAVDEAGLVDRVEVVTGDILDEALDEHLGGPFDVVMAANLCHLFDGGRARWLVARLARHVNDDGRLVIIDVLPDLVREDPGVALYALGLDVRTTAGGLHPRADYDQWLDDAGLGHTELHRTADGFAVLLAERSRVSRTSPRPGTPTSACPVHAPNVTEGRS